ncbi:hypothetical protein [Streptomyces sp. HUAS TT7]|uniref:hypothetical protein n=1 Tax=Streptomyces sp. HUAS TT7 TaxID=3447507 RepID=UPI003F655378
MRSNKLISIATAAACGVTVLGAAAPALAVNASRQSINVAHSVPAAAAQPMPPDPIEEILNQLKKTSLQINGVLFQLGNSLPEAFTDAVQKIQDELLLP